MQCGKQDHIFKHMACKPDTNLNTLRTITQRGIHNIARYHECPSFHGFEFELTYSKNAMRKTRPYLYTHGVETKYKSYYIANFHSKGYTHDCALP